MQFKESGTITSYICKPMSQMPGSNKALSNLAIRIKTGRPKIDARQQYCSACHDGVSVEDEYHLIFQCIHYPFFQI